MSKQNMKGGNEHNCCQSSCQNRLKQVLIALLTPRLMHQSFFDKYFFFRLKQTTFMKTRHSLSLSLSFSTQTRNPFCALICQPFIRPTIGNSGQFLSLYRRFKKALIFSKCFRSNGSLSFSGQQKPNANRILIRGQPLLTVLYN
jgi:hypothetical protein